MEISVYFVLTLIAAVVSALYGFYATVTDFRIKKNGQKVLSRKGYLGLALLVVATAVSLSTDLTKENQDNQAATKTENELKRLIDDGTSLGNKLGEESANLQEQIGESRDISTKLQQTGKKLDEAQSAIQQNIATADSVLHQTRRLLNPITRTGLHLSLTIVIPDQPLIRPYMNRVGKDDLLDTHINPGHKDFPEERRPEERELALLADDNLRILFESHDDLGPLPVIYLNGKCGPSELDQFHADGVYDIDRSEGDFLKTVITYRVQGERNPGDPAIQIYCDTTDILWYFARNVISWEDFKGKEMTVKVALPKTGLEYYVSGITATQDGQDRFFLLDTSPVPCGESLMHAFQNDACFSGKPGFGIER